jgi:predicted dinucleotide-binding enzyme
LPLKIPELSKWGQDRVFSERAILDEDSKGKTGSEIIASFAPGARVIKALNTLVVKWIEDYSEKKPKSVLFLSGDDADAKRKLARALEETGFVPVDIGGLIDGGKLHQFRTAERVTPRSAQSNEILNLF